MPEAAGAAPGLRFPLGVRLEITMSDWLDSVQRVEALADLPLDPALVEALAARSQESGTIRFYTPTFKVFETQEIAACGKNAWPALSITGADCKLQCDHCKAKILEPMVPVRTPELLWRRVNELIAGGAEGMLLTGGSNHRNEVEYGPFLPTLRRIKGQFPQFRIAVHAALMEQPAVEGLVEAGVDVAMLDLIGAQETITQVYHLKRSVADFERSLERLTASPLKVVPHIVIGLHYGQLLGELQALEMVARHRPQALVLVVVMPYYAPPKRPFATVDPAAVGRFLLQARARLPDLPLLLGCARPAGQAKALIDTYAVMAGVDGIAHPAEGAVELAARLGRSVAVSASCCSVSVGSEVLGGEDQGVSLDLAAILAHEQRQRAVQGGLHGIRVVAG